MPDQWDVIVVGAGTAGLMTALFAADRGAKVLLIDAADKVGGTLHLSTGSFSAAGSILQKERGIDDSPHQHFNECQRITKLSGDESLLRLWIDNAAATLDWLLGKGLDVDVESLSVGTPHELYDVPRIVTPKRNGLAYLDVLQPLLDSSIENGSITLNLNTEFTSLALSEDSGATTGVTARNPDRAEEQFFGTSVALTTGGYSANEMLWRGIHSRPNRASASVFARGDAHLAVQRLGSDLAWNDSYLPTFGGTRDCDPPHEFGFHTVMLPKFRPPWEIYINTDGERFMAEDEPSPDARERALLAQPDEMFWCVYDQAMHESAPALFMWDTEKTDRAFQTHADFQTAASLESLASQCGMDATTLVQTVATYNAARSAGADAFGRRHMPAPLTQPPYFAVKHYGVSVLSFAGVRTDSDLRVLNADGTPIGNLYAAGEVLGMGVFGNAYLGGAMISSAFTFGRLLGRDVLTW